MTTELLKSASITNLDAIPSVRSNAGSGAPGSLVSVNDYITTTTGKTTGSVYRFVRVRSSVCVKEVLFETAAQGSSTALDIGVYYSDDPLDPNYAAHAGAAITQAFFASAVDVSSALATTNVTNESGTYTVDKRNKQLWDALALSADPGGFFDIAATSTATINTGALMGLNVRYVKPGD